MEPTKFNPDPPSGHTERELELESMIEWMCGALVKTWGADQMRPPVNPGIPLYFHGQEIPIKWRAFFTACLNKAIETEISAVPDRAEER